MSLNGISGSKCVHFKKQFPFFFFLFFFFLVFCLFVFFCLLSSKLGCKFSVTSPVPPTQAGTSWTLREHSRKEWLTTCFSQLAELAGKPLWVVKSLHFSPGSYRMTYQLFHTYKQFHNGGSIITPISQVRKLRIRK